MKRLAAASAFASAMLLSGLAAAVPAAAQEDAGDKVNMVIVYGEDACPQPAEGEITVCARKAEDERFRIPENLRTSDSAANTAWTRRVESYEMVGDFGALSCDPAGAGGFTGCTQQMINAAYADKREGSDVRFSQLIEAARAERLSTIDADAAAEQERVEQIEREYMERLERERKGQLPGEVAAPAQSEAGAAEPASDEAQPEPEGDGEG